MTKNEEIFENFKENVKIFDRIFMQIYVFKFLNK